MSNSVDVFQLGYPKNTWCGPGKDLIAFSWLLEPRCKGKSSKGHEQECTTCTFSSCKAPSSAGRQKGQSLLLSNSRNFIWHWGWNWCRNEEKEIREQSLREGGDRQGKNGLERRKALEKMGEKRKDFVGKERLKKTIKRRKETKRAARKLRQVGEQLVQISH